MSSLPPEILDLFFASLSKVELFVCSKVCKDWRNRARIGIWSQITIKSRERLNFIISLLKKEEWLGKAVKQLQFDCQEIRSNEYVHWSTGGEDLEQLIELLPALSHFHLSHNCFSTIRINNLPNLSNLKSFSYSPDADDTNLDVLRSILQLSPSLSSLQLETPYNFQNDLLEPLDVALKLKRLEMMCEGSGNSQLFRTGHHFFPPGCISGLQHLVYYVYSEWCFDVNLLPEISGSSLTTLDLQSNEPITFEQLGTTLYEINNLTTLRGNIVGIPIDFLNKITPTLTHLYLSLSSDSLKHLHFNPRPELKLQLLTLGFWDKRSFKYLPIGLKVLRIEEVFGIEDILEGFEGIKKKLRKLKRIEFAWIMYYAGRIDIAQATANFRNSFKSIKVETVVEIWCSSASL